MSADTSRTAEPALQDLLRVYGHIRSGNNLLAGYLRLNFYPHLDLRGPDGYFGHWTDRQFTLGSVYGKLVGSHEHYGAASPSPNALYIHRDGRAVAYSVWRSSHFMNKEWRGMPFSEFLRRPIDWEATPARRRRQRLFGLGRENIVQHWRRHVAGWLGSGDARICFVRYEDLVERPASVLDGIVSFFRPRLDLPQEGSGIASPGGLVGFSPNQGSITAWQDAFSERDLSFYRSIVGYDFEELRDACGVAS